MATTAPVSADAFIRVAGSESVYDFIQHLTKCTTCMQWHFCDFLQANSVALQVSAVARLVGLLGLLLLCAHWAACMFYTLNLAETPDFDAQLREEYGGYSNATAENVSPYVLSVRRQENSHSFAPC